MERKGDRKWTEERCRERKDAGEMTEAAVKWPSRVEGRIREESVEGNVNEGDGNSR